MRVTSHLPSSSHLSLQYGGNPSTSKGSFFKRAIVWIHKDRPQWQKVMTYTLFVLSMIALSVSICGIPFAQQLAEENKLYQGRAAVKHSDASIIEAIGGKDAYNKLRSLSTSLPDQLSQDPAEVLRQTPWCQGKGKDQSGRPFLFFKIQDRQTHTISSIIIRRRFTHENSWIVCKGSQTDLFSGKGVIDEECLKAISSLIQGTHPQFHLAG